MYFWNTNALVKDLKQATLPEAEQVKYLLYAVVMFSLSTVLPYKSDKIFSLETAFSVAINIIGTLVAYRTNAAGDHKEFVSRYLALSVPIWLRLFVFIGLLSSVLGFLVGSFFAYKIDIATQWSGKVVGYSIPFLFYWHLNSRIREVANANVG